jgi:hypothetical protein
MLRDVGTVARIIRIVAGIAIGAPGFVFHG